MCRLQQVRKKSKFTFQCDINPSETHIDFNVCSYLPCRPRLVLGSNIRWLCRLPAVSIVTHCNQKQKLSVFAERHTKHKSGQYALATVTSSQASNSNTLIGPLATEINLHVQSCYDKWRLYCVNRWKTSMKNHELHIENKKRVIDWLTAIVYIRSRIFHSWYTGPSGLWFIP